MSTDVLDNVESINIAKFIPEYKDEAFHPFFNPLREEIEAFSRVGVPLKTPFRIPSLPLTRCPPRRNPSTSPARSSPSSPSSSSCPRTTSPRATPTPCRARTTSAT
ncbi:hypothetical protein IMZ48_08900 [Candidatus Bathyarchaeota archaeon]|nr:hypothetical protein [Candidatus Bathyarchaeota archaeon]